MLARVVLLLVIFVKFAVYCSNAEPQFMTVAAMLSGYTVIESIILLLGAPSSLTPMPGFGFYFPNPGFASSPSKGVTFSFQTTALRWEAV